MDLIKAEKKFLKGLVQLSPEEFMGIMVMFGTLPKLEKDEDWNEKSVDEILTPIVEKFNSLSNRKKKEILSILDAVEKQNKREKKYAKDCGKDCEKDKNVNSGDCIENTGGDTIG
jgi:hypothetical protein